jgi:hypothetical protein
MAAKPLPQTTTVQFSGCHLKQTQPMAAKWISQPMPFPGATIFSSLARAGGAGRDGKINGVKQERKVHMHKAYKSARTKAWRNAMVAAINAGLDRQLFTLADKQNLWPGADADEGRSGQVFAFKTDGIPAVAHVHDAGWDELRVQVAPWPTADGGSWIRSLVTAHKGKAAWLAGDLVAGGWLERRKGLYLMEYGGGFRCRAHRLEEAAKLSVSPKGYADHGRFIL